MTKTFLMACGAAPSVSVNCALAFEPEVDANVQIAEADPEMVTTALLALVTLPAAGVAVAPFVQVTANLWPFFVESDSVTVAGLAVALAGETEKALAVASSSAASSWATPPQAATRITASRRMAAHA